MCYVNRPMGGGEFPWGSPPSWFKIAHFFKYYLDTVSMNQVTSYQMESEIICTSVS